MTGMINVKGKLETTDRWNLTITKVEPNETKWVNPQGVAYVMMRNGNFKSDRLLLKDANATVAISEECTVACGKNSSACIVEYPGLRLQETRAYVQNELDIGNLSYIDGGSNTTAINPGRLGDPVINYVHFPAHMYQTLHTHPSHRIGFILKGNGRVELDNKKYHQLIEGDIFYMRRNTLHNFICNEEDVILYVFAPDSGTGPTDEVNPLKIRTYIGQQRAVK